MHCPFCSAVDTKVIDSRLVGEGSQVRRRRQCLVCHERFTTFEVAELVMPRVIKSNEVREPFNEDKLRSGMLKALEKGRSVLMTSKWRLITLNLIFVLPVNVKLPPRWSATW